jgi:hypothetical protein
VVAALLLSAATAPAQSRPVVAARITIDTTRVVNRFDPRTTFGAGIDGHGIGVVEKVFTRANLAAMQAVGFSMATYRLRTELGVQAWHWNPNGRWSDAAQQRGYWTSFDSSTAPVDLSHGYRLPRRGTTDENDDSKYSRLDDGDTTTFWKSNPYLAEHFTGTADSLLPQWVIVDLGTARPVDAIRIHWGMPHARAFKVQYRKGELVHDMDESPAGRWFTFANGAERAGVGGTETRVLDRGTITTRFVRIVMSASASDAPAGSRDVRDALGYAIRELAVGTLQPDGAFRDLLRHGAESRLQSTTYASSTDPWHAASDIDRDLEQPGLDRFFRSGVTNGRPAMVPVPVLYGVPDDAAAMIRFLRTRGYAIGKIEMGEEPDGQFVTPEDYGTLYVQAARAIRADWPDAPLGGPSFQGLEIGAMFAWPVDSAGERWVPRLLRTLRERGRPGDFTFFSFEWYPWDAVCSPTAPQLAGAAARFSDRLGRAAREGMSAYPWVIAEFGYSAFAGRAQVGIEGALLNADIVGHFLSMGGAQAYLYGWEPTSLDKSPRCDGWGNNMLFLSDDERRIRATVATYHGMRMMLGDWTIAAGGEHRLFTATTGVRDRAGNELLSAYPVLRPDGTRATLIVNKDPARTFRVSLGGLGRRTVVSYSAAQYAWKNDGPKGRPSRNLPPTRQTLTGGRDFSVPPYSLTVVLDAPK